MRKLVPALISMMFCLSACASVAQESEQKNPTVAEVFGFTPWQELDLTEAVSVSFYELIVNGGKYDDQFIRVSGIFRYEEKNNEVWAQRLYSDRESFEYLVDENSIAVREFLPECLGAPLDQLHGEFLSLSGVYRHSSKMLSPVDLIRWLKVNDKTGEIEKNEILCKDSSLIFSIPESDG